MKKVTLLLTLFAVSLGYAQIAPIDFETGGNGATWTWTVFENGDLENPTPPLEIIANPDPSGINTSATVAKFTAQVVGAPFAGVESQHGSDIGGFTFTADNSIVKIMVWKSVISDVGIKFAENNGEAQPEIKIPNTLTNQWEEITFDVSSLIGKGITGIIDQIIIFPDFNARTQENIVYFDNITFPTPGAPTCTDGIENGDEEGIDCGGSCGTVCITPAPLVSAPLATTLESDVLFIYSDVYTNPTNQVSFLNADWAVTPPSNINTSTEVVISGTTDNVRYITDIGLLYAPIPNTNVSTFNYFHIDIWSTDATFVIVKWESGIGPEAGDVSVTLTPNQWTGVDIDLNTWGALADPAARGALRNLIFDATGGKDFYFDNIYFSKTSL